MPVNTKRVFYVEVLADKLYEDVISKRPDIRLDRLENKVPTQDALAAIESAHVYQISSGRNEIIPELFAGEWLIARAKNLLVVSTAGAGYDTVDIDLCTKHGILAVNQAGGNREAVAEHALAMMLSLTKQIPQIDKAMRREDNLNRMRFRGEDMLGKTVGVIGIGYTGSRTAEFCKGLFAMRVLAYDPYLSQDQIAKHGAEKVELEKLLRESDFISVHCPLNDETEGMFGAKQFAMMQPGAYFVSTARGFIHDEKALYDALKSGVIKGAGLDVWDKEPPPKDHPLLTLDNVIASVHTAGVTRQARQTIGRIGAEQVIDILDGKKPVRILNPEVWPKFSERFEAIFGFKPGI